jgi:hypothetical protein
VVRSALTRANGAVVARVKLTTHHKGTGMLNWAGFLAGVVGVVLAVVFYYQAQRDPRPIAKIITGDILSPLTGLRRGPFLPPNPVRILSPDDVELIEMSYNKMPISELCVTFVALWNAGNGTLNSSSLVERDPLRLVFPPDVTIVDYRLIADVASNGLALTVPDPKVPEVHITFDFLNSGDGGIIRILHDGSVVRPKFAGQLREVRGGVRTIPAAIGDITRKGAPWRIRARHALIATAVLLVFPALAALPFALGLKPDELWFGLFLVSVTAAMLFVPGAWLAIWLTRNVIPSEIRALNRLYDSSRTARSAEHETSQPDGDRGTPRPSGEIL